MTVVGTRPWAHWDLATQELQLVLLVDIMIGNVQDPLVQMALVEMAEEANRMIEMTVGLTSQEVQEEVADHHLHLVPPAKVRHLVLLARRVPEKKGFILTGAEAEDRFHRHRYLGYWH